MSSPSRKSSTTPSSGEPSTSGFHDHEKGDAAVPETTPLPVAAPPPAAAAAVSPPPDGGFVAWLQVVGSFFLFMNSWGVVNSFGVFQTFYETDFLSHETPSNISWIGSVQAFLLLMIGVSTGPLFDLGWFTTLIASGSFFIVFGLMMTSLCSAYWQVMLAQGILIGLGSGLVFVPSVAIVSTYFDSKKALATGIAVAGSSIGGVLYPIIFNQLQPSIGFGWATRVIAFIALATLLLSIAIMRVRVQPRAVRRMLDLSAFAELPFTTFSVGCLFGFMGTYIPFFYIQSYAAQRGVDPALSFYTVSVLNAASTFGRIIPNFFADRTGPLNVLVPCCLCAAVLAFSWIAIDDLAGIFVFCVFYGFFSGTFVSLPPTTVITLTRDLSVVGARMGMSFAFGGVGILIGNPVAGAILDRHGWIGLKCFCGACVLLASILCGIARMSRTTKLLGKA
ncbi:Riboflavin transporter MCH5 [Escovopsis weberi]|uniref:Riboflavin transporter MCH5 n=1 Tax=Escovopsis weberi TaxID=150374 RepID=A0A0M8MUL6_ESCWE|nr:Riboflavin transporter MCH5 [Escovopsis weberi]